ncbi:hypothetical protein B5M43_014705 [Microbacterium sp. MEC084]|uniref:hypothetical protein n=1 Tax=unclassified Microbacterium TaxID=2609290 RepID=UPI000700268E|nr:MULTISPECIES: hypothetical protein [unclassified Microbacterium]KQZ05800.1 hypothetical protein ASD19_13270 [Microbacterium sp. Root53]MCD1270056.1 hypothetical protein [Microbacterium sp. MEC084]
MGQNRRHPHNAGRLAEQRELREARANGPLRRLSSEQLGQRVVSIVPDSMQLWGLAWLRFGDVDVRATVRVRRWTDDAVGVEVDVDGERLRCWVWQGACQRIADQRAGW